MQSQDRPSRLASSAEYALILGSGLGAVTSLAVQQLAVASLPVTVLVALGLLNRYRLDHQTQVSSLWLPQPKEITKRAQPLRVNRVVAVPKPEMGDITPLLRHRPRPGLDKRQNSKTLQVKRQAQHQALQAIGQQLQQVRSEQNLSVEMVHQKSYLQMHQIRAMEAGHLEALPQPFYVQRLIYKYAQFLGLDAKTLADSFPL